ncbi:MAG: Ig-like domain-containing protein [Planctomycetes bacterium]|nr:Ig-like domain-containing protein [Planctomycetota bacterium]
MFHRPHVRSHAASQAPSHSLLASLGAFALFFASCSGGGGAATDAFAEGLIVAAPQSNPAAPTYFVAEDPSDGEAARLQLLEVYWGRLVQVYDRDGVTPIFPEFVIDDRLTSDGDDYLLERNPLTDVETLRILHPFRDANGDVTPQFRAALAGLEADLQVVLKKNAIVNEIPPFTAVPRNGALLLKFNDLLASSTIDAETVKLLAGYPPTQPFEARIFADPSHGNIAGGQFHSTRVIVDFAVSELDALATGLPLNPLGLPAAQTTAQPNILLRIPTRESQSAQQPRVLRALSGRALAFDGNGPTDPLAPTLDVVRAVRSGGAEDVTGDASNGFLLDNTPPRVIGQQAIELLNTLNFTLTADLELNAVLRFRSVACAFSPKAGDQLVFNSTRLRVVADAAGFPVGGQVQCRVRPLCDTCEPPIIPVNTNNPPVGLIRAPYRPLPGSVTNPDYPACFLTFLPAPDALPATGVSTNATVSITFSEPVDPASVLPFDTFVIEHDNNLPVLDELYRSVVGSVVPSADRRTFTFQPRLPLRKALAAPNVDRYRVRMAPFTQRVRDLAGNDLVENLPDSRFTLSSTSPAVDSAGVRLRFPASFDENSVAGPEIRGQFLYDAVRESIKPRAVQRFSSVVDRTVPIVGIMQDLPLTNIQTPLSNRGSRMMRVWRYSDISGFSLRDETTHNVDIDGIWWQPFSGALQVDNFSEFSIGVAHSRFLPDEALNAGLLPAHRFSGLVPNFDTNLLDKANDPMTILAPRSRGYQVNPSDLAASSTGNPIAPFPINRGIPQSEFVYWTWRDTAKTAVGAPLGVGADIQRLLATSAAGTINQGFYPVNKVPTIGLPMLTEFRTYPDALAIGQNGFRIAIAINSSAEPFFRVFSTGGVDSTNTVNEVNPDTSTTASGGFNPASIPPGASTPGTDNVFYYGQADFIVRISRVHTIWFDTLAPGTTFAEPYLEPNAGEQPSGTQLILAYRGASGFSPAPGVGQFPFADARNFDPYGNLYTSAQNAVLNQAGVFATTPQFFPSSLDSQWRNSASAINGSRYVQLRLTFLSNPVSGLSPELGALGLAFRR